ncbi:MAG: MucR family transcriptional regulator [Pseudomonadota bacterium]
MNTEPADAPAEKDQTLHLAVEIVSSYVSNNQVPASDIAPMVRDIHAALAGLNTELEEPSKERPPPAVPIKKSITDDYIVCLEDGKQLKMLKRYLRTHYDLTPEAYRERWGLPHDYPMVAPNYAKQRSQFAKDIGLGRAAKKRTTTTKKKT